MFVFFCRLASFDLTCNHKCICSSSLNVDFSFLSGKVSSKHSFWSCTIKVGIWSPRLHWRLFLDKGERSPTKSGVRTTLTATDTSKRNIHFNFFSQATCSHFSPLQTLLTWQIRWRTSFDSWRCWKLLDGIPHNMGIYNWASAISMFKKLGKIQMPRWSLNELVHRAQFITSRDTCSYK